MSDLTLHRRRRLDVSAVLLLLLTVSYPINRSFIMNLRIADFVILAFILVTLPRVRFRSSLMLALVLAFFALYGTSMVYGSFALGIITASNFLFAYKYAVVFLLFAWLVAQRFETELVDRIASYSFMIYGLLIMWVFVHFILWTLRLTSGSLRVSFPFSGKSDPGASDAPLYSVVLATCFIAYAFYPGRCRGRRVLPFMALLVTVAAIVLSGSRTGLIAIGVTLVIAGAARVFSAVQEGRVRFSLRMVLLVLLIGTIAVIVMSRLLAADINGFRYLVERVFKTDVAKDVSIGSRLEKVGYALDSIFLRGPIFIGLGMQSSWSVWFDNAYAGVLFATGLGGLFVLLTVIRIFLTELRATARRNGTWAWYRGLFYLFVSYLVSGFSSEFFLVTRGFVPFAILCMVYIHHIRIPARLPIRGDLDLPTAPVASLS